MNVVFLVMSLVLYVAILAGFFAIVYVVFKKAIKDGLVEAYKEIQKLK